MPFSSKQPVIFTDLDGTLLSHDDYSFDPVADFLPSLDGIDVIPATSKTRPEVEKLRRALGLQGPFITENGAAIYFPGMTEAEPVSVDGRSFEPESTDDGVIYRTATEISSLLDFVAAFEHDLINFVTCPIEQAVDLTGLSVADAEAARQREHTVPVVIADDSVKETFIAAAQGNGFSCLQGGRFLHLQGACDKGLALRLTCSIMEKLREIKHHAIALGDSENDRKMLEAADTAVVVFNPAVTTLSIDAPATIYTTAPAPAGWVEGVRAALESMDRQQQ